MPVEATATAPPVSGREFPEITIRGLEKRFGNEPVYQGFDLDIDRHKVTTIFGPNGCGKSTLLNMIAGLTSYEGGEILFDGRPRQDVRLGFVFQNYRDALMPWRRAIDNIAYPLELLGLPRADIQRRVDEVVADFDIQFDLRRYPYQMSGGQQQLVSIMRALAPDPEIICFDEPFSALDYEMTLFVRDMLQRLFVKTGKTLLIVSHDIEEAVWLADRVVLLTRRPTRVAEVVSVDLPHPRDMDTLADPRFVAIRQHALAVFQREVRA